MTRPLEKLSLFIAQIKHSAPTGYRKLMTIFTETRSWQRALLRALLFGSEPGRRRFTRSAIHRFVCAVMVIVMPVQMVIASPEISQSMAEAVTITSINWRQRLEYRWESSGWAESTARFVREKLPFLRPKGEHRKAWDGNGAPAEPMPRPRAQETQAERNARVVRVEVLPEEVTVSPDQPAEFTVIGYDSNNLPVSSLPYEISGEEETNGEQLVIKEKGKFSAAKEGEYRVKVTALGHPAEARVKVKGSARVSSDKPDKPVETRTYSSRDLPMAPRSTSSVQPDTVLSHMKVNTRYLQVFLAAEAKDNPSNRAIASSPSRNDKR